MQLKPAAHNRGAISTVLRHLTYRTKCVCVLAAMFFIYPFADNPASATMLWDFTPGSNGGVELHIVFDGITQPDSIQERWIELILPSETMLGGGIARSDLYFADTLTGEFTLDGQTVTSLYIRLGNGLDDEQFFIFHEPGITAGQLVHIDLHASWDVDNLAYASLSPGTYAATRPRYGDAIVTIAPLPEPSSALLLMVAMSFTFAARSK